MLLAQWRRYLETGELAGMRHRVALRARACCRRQSRRRVYETGVCGGRGKTSFTSSQATSGRIWPARQAASDAHPEAIAIVCDFILLSSKDTLPDRLQQFHVELTYPLKSTPLMNVGLLSPCLPRRITHEHETIKASTVSTRSYSIKARSAHLMALYNVSEH